MVNNIVSELLSFRNEKNVEGMKRFKIGGETTILLGISLPQLRKMAKNISRDHDTALQLWEAEIDGKNIHEARMLAAFTAEPDELTPELMDSWIMEFESWDLCDQVCSNLFDKTKFAHDKANEWSYRKREFEKRAGFVMMAALAVHDKKADDSAFESYFKRIEEESEDDRNFVKKAVNWALRQIGKRNMVLHKKAAALAKKLTESENKTARWIGKDAYRELTSEKTILRIKR